MYLAVLHLDARKLVDLASLRLVLVIRIPGEAEKPAADDYAGRSQPDLCPDIPEDEDREQTREENCDCDASKRQDVPHHPAASLRPLVRAAQLSMRR